MRSSEGWWLGGRSRRRSESRGETDKWPQRDAPSEIARTARHLEAGRAGGALSTRGLAPEASATGWDGAMERKCQSIPFSTYGAAHRPGACVNPPNALLEPRT